MSKTKMTRTRTGLQPATYTLVVTRDRALQLGLLTCAHCGYPENNHFDWSPYPCAHDTECPGYKEVLKT